MSLGATTLPSPVGTLTLVASARGLAAVLWENDRPGRVRLEPWVAATAPEPVLRVAAAELDAYFAGRLRRFTVPLDATGTPFQRDVWAALLLIPFGETRSYGAIARQTGRPGASRAVGTAIGRNPISIITPCHRVIGSTGALTGFAGGLATKETLLALEGRGSAPHPARSQGLLDLHP